MYDPVVYHLDSQPAMYDALVHTPTGRALFIYRCVTLALCAACFASALVFARRAAAPAPQAAAPDPRDKAPHRAALWAGVLIAAGLYALHPLIAFEYMDFAYYYEGEFRSVLDLVMKRQYFSNVHTPGYLLLVWLVKGTGAPVRAVLLFVSAAAMAAAAVPLYRVARTVLEPHAAAAAVAGWLISPVAVLTLYRISPYALVAAGFVLAADRCVRFLETDARGPLVQLCVILFVIPFLHVISVVGIVFLLAALCALVWRRRPGWRPWLARVAGPCLAAGGALLFNVSFFLVFMDFFAQVTHPLTERLQVYYVTGGGHWEYVLLVLRVVFNLGVSFVSLGAGTAAAGGLLFAAGCAAAAGRRAYGAVAALPALGCVCVLLMNIFNYRNLHSYPMSYRHLATLWPFLVVMVFAGAAVAGRLAGGRARGAALAAALMLALFAANLPGTIQRLRAPDMFPALRHAFRNAQTYDGVIPGNMFFMNEYAAFMLEPGRSEFIAEPMYGPVEPGPASAYAFTRWYIIKPAHGGEPASVFMNMAPFHLDSFATLLQNNFVQRVWYLDHDTRRFGVFPDFSGWYEQSVREALRGAELLEMRSFRGVALKLYSVSHEPVQWNARGQYAIDSGRNDFYFIRGVEPATEFFSETRRMGPGMELLAFLPRPVDGVEVRVDMATPAADHALMLVRDVEADVAFAPVSRSEREVVYRVPYAREQGFVHLLFEECGGARYRRVIIAPLRAGEHPGADARNSQ
mgnify:CR=1 FL=1